MRRLVTAVLVAVVLPLTGPAMAAADPSSGSESRCSGPVQVAPEISVTTCTVYQWWDYHGHVGFRAKVTVRNASTSYSVLAAPDLLVGGSVYLGSTSTIPPGATLEMVGNMVQDPPPVTKQGRGWIAALNWSTYTYAPAY